MNKLYYDSTNDITLEADLPLPTIPIKHIMCVGDSSISYDYSQNVTNFADIITDYINLYYYNGTTHPYKAVCTKTPDFFGQTSGAIAGQVTRFNDYSSTNGIPDVIILDVGANDLLAGVYNSTTLKANIRTIVGALRTAYGSGVKIIGCIPWHFTGEAGYSDATAFRTALTEVYGVNDLNVHAISDFSTLWTIGQASTNLTDGLHPNTTGSDAIANGGIGAVIIGVLDAKTDVVATDLLYAGRLTGREEITVARDGVNYKLKIRDFLNDTILKNRAFRQTPSLFITLGKCLQWDFTKISYKPLLFSHFSDVGNNGANATALYSDTIPANTLIADGDVIKAEYSGMLANNSNTKYIAINFNGSQVAVVSTTVANMPFNIEMTLIRDSSTTAKLCFKFIVQDAFTNTQYTTATVTNWTATRALELYAQGTATNDIVAKMGFVELKPV